jgi:hypothetical protein
MTIVAMRSLNHDDRAYEAHINPPASVTRRR